MNDAQSPSPTILDVGCGPRKFRPDAIGIDVVDFPGVDIVGDARACLSQMAADSVAAIYSSHFLEHLDDPLPVLVEMARVLRPGGLLEIRVPHFANPYYYSDPTHETFFGLYTLDYWGVRSDSRRSVPPVSEQLPLVMRARRLKFKSDPAFPARRLLKQGIEALVNLNPGTQELHEEVLAWTIPPYEIQFLLSKVA